MDRFILLRLSFGSFRAVYSERDCRWNNVCRYLFGRIGRSRPMGPGVKMMRNGTTIRHQFSKGNGGNLSVNDRIPFRFIVAPTDVENNNKNWMAVQGVNDGGQNQNPDFTTTANTGCRWYGTAGAPGAGRKWRVPTQRELQLMWLFREPIGLIYKDKPMEESGKTKRYWTSTEKGTDQAWFLTLRPVYLTVIPRLKVQRMVW